MVRTPGCDKNTGLRKGTWTPEEDKKLFAYVTRYGSWNWRQLPKFAGLKRCGKSCRLRWLNYLRPNIKRGNYTKEEEEAIIKLHESLGNRWAAIAAYLPGRTDNEIKNHWHTHLYKRVLLVKQNINNNEDSETVQEACRKVRSVSEPKDSQVLNPNIILNSSPVLVQSPIQSSSEVSTTTTETGTEANSVLALAADKRLNNTSSNSTATSFDPFDEFSDTFWTEPFFTDMNTISSYNFSPLSSEFMSHLMDPEMILGSELLDTNYFCYSGLYHEEQDDNLLLFGNFQNANY